MNDNISNYENNEEEPPKLASPLSQIPEEPTPVVPPAGLWTGEEPVGSITSPCETGSYRMVLRDYAATVQIEGSLVSLDYTEIDSRLGLLRKLYFVKYLE